MLQWQQIDICTRFKKLSLFLQKPECNIDDEVTNWESDRVMSVSVFSDDDVAAMFYSDSEESSFDGFNF